MDVSEHLNEIIIYMNAILRSKASELKLSASQALQLLSIPYGGITMSRLSQKMGLDNSTLTRNIKKLEIRKYIARKSDKFDKRITNIILTPRGIKMIDELESMLKEEYSMIFKQMDEEGKQVFIHTLENISWSLQCFNDNEQSEK
tara:strand:+ start:324 stop:758 length:435 start_codon:yes stop_codon:yes gene_type:complete